MAITQASLTSNSDTTDTTSYTTASVTNTVNRLLLLSVASSRAAADPSVPTITGLSLTWVQVNTALFATTLPQHRRVTVFRALGASATGTVLIDFAAETQTGCMWSLQEFDNVDTSGANGSGAIVQSVPGTSAPANSLTITLAAFSSTNNATYGTAFTLSTITPGAGFTEISESSTTVPTNTMEVEWRVDNDTTVDWTSVPNDEWGGVALEIRAAGGWAHLLSNKRNRLVNAP